MSSTTIRPADPDRQCPTCHTWTWRRGECVACLAQPREAALPPAPEGMWSCYYCWKTHPLGQCCPEATEDHRWD